MSLRQRKTHTTTAVAKDLLNRDDALSTDEQQLVVQYLEESNNASNKWFLLLFAVLHGVVGAVYLFMFASKDQTFVFLLNPKTPSIVIRAAMLVCALVLFYISVVLAQFCRVVKSGITSVNLDEWTSRTQREREALVAEECNLIGKAYAQPVCSLRRASAISALPAALFVFEIFLAGEWTVLDVVAAVWQPLLHVGVSHILWWMRDSSTGVVRLLSTAYHHEKV